MANDVKQTTVRFDSDLHTRLKVVCARNHRKMNDVITELVEEYVQEQEALQNVQNRAPESNWEEVV